MTKHRIEIPVSPRRLSDVPIAEDPVGVGSLFRSALPVESPTWAARQALKWRLRKTLNWRRRGTGALLRPIVVGALVLLSGGFLGAAIQRLAGRTAATAPSESLGVPSAARSRGAIAPDRHRADPAPDRAVASPSPALDAPSEHARQRSSRPEVAPRSRRASTSPSPAPVLAAPEAATSTPEHTLLASAVRTLRIEQRPAEALAALDLYEARFPAGVLASEAAVLRAEALLRLDRKEEAIVALGVLLERPLPGNRERRILRGELRGALGAWREAFADFDAALESLQYRSEARPDDDHTRALVERAFWGRIVARGRLGDESGARAELVGYLKRFPSGMFAVQATRALASPR